MKTIDILKPYISDRRAEKIEQTLSQRTREFTVVLDRFDKPHNFMAVLRTCDAFGIQDVHIIPLKTGATDIDRTITQGSHKWLTLHFHKDWSSAFETLKKSGFKLYAAYLDEQARGLETHDLTGKIALVFGNELNGLDAEEAKACDGTYLLPMKGFAQSYNVSVACALSLQRMVLAREANGIETPGLSSSEKAILLDEWYIKAVKNARRYLDHAQKKESRCQT